MATTITSFAHSYPVSSLDTYNYTIQVAGMHVIQVQLTDFTNLSGVSVIIKQGATTIASTSGISAAQPALSIAASFNAAVSDVISVAITSTAASDAAPNQVKGNISLRQAAA